MQRLLAIAAACVICGAMAVGQNAGTDHPAATTATQSSARQSAPNQDLPGNSNPGNTVTKDGRANAQTVRPNQPSSGTTGTAAGTARDNQAAPRDDSSSNPTKTSDANTPIPRGNGTLPWLWIAVGVGIVLGIALMAASLTRGRATDVDPMDPGMRARRDDVDRRDDRIRRVG